MKAFLLIGAASCRLAVVDFDFDEKFTIKTRQEHSGNADDVYTLNGRPETHFEIELKPIMNAKYYCLDEIIRIYDDKKKVDLLDSVCGRFVAKPITSCSNKLLVEINEKGSKSFS